MRLAAGSGALLPVLMWTAVLPSGNNMFMEDHLVYALVLVLLAAAGAGTTFGLGSAWERRPFVSRNPWLTSQDRTAGRGPAQLPVCRRPNRSEASAWFGTVVKEKS
jgi:hypothetical protein